MSHWNRIRPCLVIVACLTAPVAKAETVTYTLENVVLQEGPQMFGTFTFTYTPGDFENGDGAFSFLDIPFTTHDHTDLEAMFDIGSSIEIVLDGSVHDDGVDISLFVLQPLTPTSGSLLDLSRSAYEIGGNGFHTGVFLSGEIVVEATGVGDTPVGASRIAGVNPNPFNPKATIRFTVDRHQIVRLTIHDVEGRRVAELAHREFGAGEHELVWDGKGDDGEELGSGVYLAKLESPAGADVSKMILLK